MNAEQKLQQLVAVVQELSLARSLDAIMEVIRHEARHLTGADGATFILREGDQCYYAEEDAIEALWKGRRFPMNACISGWVMEHRQSAVIEDIYSDERIPADVYRPTFVRSLVMVPVRTVEPIAAIGTYWAEPRGATTEDLHLLQSLADTAAVAMENVRVYGELEQRVCQRTAQLERTVSELQEANKEIRTLRGIIPICSHCKGVRDDSGYWHRLESYLMTHTEAELSHGICPDCVEMNFSDYVSVNKSRSD
ncbi:MAG: GAF domain-containing protein [Pseudohongiellaceae bacterium]